MNYELFIANRIISKKKDKSTISSPIIKIAIIAIALGIIIMIISISTGLGLKFKIRDKIASLNGHIQVSNLNRNFALNTQNPIAKKEVINNAILGIDGVKRIQSFAQVNGMIRTETDFETIIFKGVDKEYDWSFFNEYLDTGKTFKITDTTTNKILLSKITADRLNFKVGDKVIMWFLNTKAEKLKAKPRVFYVTGIFSTGVKEFDEAVAIGDIKLVQGLHKWKPNQVGGFELFLTDFDEINSVTDKVYNELDPTLNAESVNNKFPNLFDWINLFDVNISLIIIIMIIISGINMITALLVLIIERTQMIGVLKALGNQNKSIRKIFLYNAGYIIIRGLIWGNAIAFLIILTDKYLHIVKLNPVNYYVKNVPYHINFTQIILLNAGTLLLCLIMLIIPTIMVSKINPVKAIKFE